MTTIDYIDPLPTLGPPLTPEQRTAMRAMHERLKPGLARAATNLFVIEAPCNHQPFPPAGWFAVRSSTHRLFMQLENDGTRMPSPDEIQRRLEVGEFTEVPLT